MPEGEQGARAGAGSVVVAGGNGGGGAVAAAGAGGQGQAGRGGASESCEECQDRVAPECAPVYGPCLANVMCAGLVECFTHCDEADDPCNTACFVKWEPATLQYYEVASCFVCRTCSGACPEYADECEHYAAALPPG